ncbi:MAG TPA: HAMP domain-containing sensor histidine kinase [Bdellovibrionota bacterium]|jgi:signal transduction histidine kinase|nr:HAMP domain-containing sensor histidine kinase [Bdellovibrionota bacterium]
MTPRQQAAILRRRISISILPPVLIMAVIFLLTTGSVFYRNAIEQGRGYREDLSATINYQRDAIAQEVYLSRSEALQIRFDEILRTWHRKHPGISACLVVYPDGDVDTTTTKVAKCTSEERIKTFEGDEKLSSTIDLKIGNSRLARLIIFVVPEVKWYQIIPSSIWWITLLSIIVCWAVHRILIWRLETNLVTPYIRTIAENERNSAIAQTTQMIAHDVRRPFAILKVSLDVLKTCAGKKDIQPLLNQMSRDVGHAMNSVNSMLHDIMDLGSQSSKPLKTAPTAIEELVEAALKDCQCEHLQKNVHMHFDFRSTKKVVADAHRISRAMTNIIENAIQAMRGTGEIFFSSVDTRHDDQPAVEISIRNTGSHIEPAVMGRIFESFYSHDKPSGTGLGLAIVKNAVQLHGGTVHCTSSESEGVCFSITLPAAREDEDSPSQTLVTNPV